MTTMENGDKRMSRLQEEMKQWCGSSDTLTGTCQIFFCWEKLTKSNILEEAMPSHVYSYLGLESHLMSCPHLHHKISPTLNANQVIHHLHTIALLNLQEKSHHNFTSDMAKKILFFRFYFILCFFSFIISAYSDSTGHANKPLYFFWCLFCFSDGLFSLSLWFTGRNEHHSGRGAAFTTHYHRF